ncbi:NACHT domain-containing protein [Microcoleus sp. OTE_8_concoct_300]|uniref:NACHT domain-containing protein n=1 Tax=Microcoleus sp. OTE_8_concoct_300 TaxID=2964710 RepID=UPI00403F6B4F
MGRTNNWGDAPLKRAKHLIKFLVDYDNHSRSKLSAEWRNENSDRPELEVRTTLLDLASLLYPERIPSNRDPKAKEEKSEIQSTIDRLKELEIVRENSSPGEKSKGIRRFTFSLWHASRVEHNLRQLELAWGNRPKSEKSKTDKTASVSIPPKSDVAKKELPPQLESTIKTYLSKSFSADKFAELDQAGEPETGGERRTELKQVFIDLEVKLCERINPRDWSLEKFAQSGSRVSLFDSEDFFVEGSDNYSAMKCLLKEKWLKVVIIGGPGQGKSTLGQQVAQVYRAKWLGKSYDFADQINVKRIPFRVVLKYFAQWLANKPDSDSIEAYLAKNIGDVALRPGEIYSKNIQEIFECKKCLLILDGLDEVVDPHLQERMLSSIYSFLDWTEHSDINLKVLATSRPNIYEDQFDPKSFLHLELLPLSSKQVKKYANKWVARRDLRKEEQDRILRTLEECQQDGRISTLLKTPLQVTIILLIIKNGGRPPGEREALFDEYWNTILKREKSKDKDIIKVDDTTLLDLNAYVGYLLHYRASNETVESFLAEEFKTSLIKFLQKKDQQSSQKDINLRVDQFVSDAKDRLVLIVSPRPGFFGFELRSFQEFFASVYLFKKRERFELLTSIVGSEHWHYVALFLAGRIIRVLGEEADSIVRLGCRQVDKPRDEEVANDYLRPGAWFALEVAADGYLSKQYRNLQREAIDYGLEMLETGLTEGQQHKLSSLTAQLSERDKRDLLRPALEGKLSSKDLPETCWEVSLNLYGQHFGSTPFFQNKIDDLLELQQKNFVLSALNLALRYESEPSWMVERLQSHWSYWKKDIPSVFFRSHTYAEKLLNAWDISKPEATELAQTIFDSPWRYEPFHSTKELVWDWPEPKTLSEQLILMLRCLRIIAFLRMQLRSNRLDMRIDEGDSVLSSAIRRQTRENYQSSVLFVPDDTAETVERLLQHSELISELRVSLETILWLINQPNQANVSSFIESIRSIEQSVGHLRKFLFNSGLRETWPLLALAVERQKVKGQDAVNRLLPFLDGETQISIADQVVETIQEYFKQSDETQKQRFFMALREQIGLDEILPGLKQFAEQMDLTVDELVGAYIKFYSGYEYPGSQQNEYTIDQIKKLLTTATDAIKQGDKPKRPLWFIFEFPWPSDLAVIGQARQLLEAILDNYSESSEFPITELSATLFLKLLVYDTHIQEIAPRLFTILPVTKLWKIRRRWLICAISGEIAPEYLSVLQSLTQHEEEAVRVGSALLFKAVIDSIDRYPGYRKTAFKALKSIRVDSSLGMSFINDDDSKRRLIGITLLTLSSNYPVEDVNYRNLIWDNLKQPKTDEEEAAWNKLLQEILMPEEKYPMWRKLLEGILAKPSFYSSSVLSAAMERYQEIAKTADLTIPEIE